MSKKELDRVAVMARIAERRLKQTEAARLLGLSTRQVGRLFRAYKRDSAGALASKKRGRTSNRQLPDELKQRALALVRSRYHDFGPTLACEKLAEVHDVVVGIETLRSWMIEAEIWVPRSRRARRSYQLRQRRECFGELVQIDGCKHEWFEDRGPACALLVFVDDATGALMELRMAEIDIICANSPQAKGRVERMNSTLQDRLVKELRLAGVSSMQEAGPVLEAFRLDYNRRFARLPKSERDAHRVLGDHEDLHEIFTVQATRLISQELLLHYKRNIYAIEDTEDNRKLRGVRATACEFEDGEVEIVYDDRRLAYRVHPKDNARISQGSIVEHKRLEAVLRVIAEKQEKRDRERLANPKITLREKARIRSAAGL